jgi:phosphoribosyl 1,2-cyclic phosphodiesterase
MEKGKITFLGTGGGRVVVSNQVRATGGWILEMDGEMLHIDPGPGALVRAKQYGVRLKYLTGLLVSHCHPDHYSDLEVAIEAMTLGTTRKKGTLITNEFAIKGGENFHPIVSRYHLNALKKHHALKPGESASIGRIKVTATKTKHGNARAIGFVFKGSKTIGYTSDGEYYPGMEDRFRGCDCLVMNCLRPRNNTWPEHMNINQAARLVMAVKPRLAVLNHFGMLMIRAGVEKETAWIEKDTGIDTIAAKDGMVISLESMKPVRRQGRPF